MRKLDYYVVDVFAENRYEGNQLAVFLGGENLTEAEMLRIAKEINYAEITFLQAEAAKNGGYNVRIFTPVEEVPFAGHPSLGTAYIIQTQILNEPVSKITLNEKAGSIPISWNKQDSLTDVLWMEQLPPAFSRILPPESLLSVLNITENDLDLRYPIQEVSTGLPTLIVPMKNSEAVRKCRLDQQKYFEMVNRIDAKLIHAFCPGEANSGNEIRVRNFGDYYGVSEEPATGSANGCLAGYLVKHKYFGKERINIRVEQGKEIGRLGHLYLQASQNDKGIKVHVGGKVWLVAKGEFYI